MKISVSRRSGLSPQPAALLQGGYQLFSTKKHIYISLFQNECLLTVDKSDYFEGDTCFVLSSIKQVIWGISKVLFLSLISELLFLDICTLY